MENRVHWHTHHIDKSYRSKQKGQKPCLLWFTGFSGAGKSTVAGIVEQKLAAAGKHTYLLDGDNVRHGISKDLGFSDADRTENIRRIGEVSKLFLDCGIVTLSAFISPFEKDRLLVRDLLEDGEFIEVYCDTPLEVCEERDPKGLYKKARSGEIKNFTGIDSDYEAPKNPEIHLIADGSSAEELADQVLEYLHTNGYFFKAELADVL